MVAVSAESREAQSVVDDIKGSIAELEQENQMGTISVELVDSEVARVFQSSARAEVDFYLYFLNKVLALAQVLGWPSGSVLVSHQCRPGSIPGWRSDPDAISEKGLTSPV